MSDQPNGTPEAGAPVQPQGGNTVAAQGAAETITGIDPVLAAKIAKLEADNFAYREERRKQDAATENAKRDQLIKDQQWQELSQTQAAELEKLKPVVEQGQLLTEAFNELLESQLKQIPANIRKNVIDPAREAMDPVKFSKWLRDNMDTFRAQPAPNMNPGEGNGGTPVSPIGNGQLTAQDWEFIRATGIKPEEWLKNKIASEFEKANPHQ